MSAVLDLLRSLEWCGGGEITGWCPVCDEADSHAPDCRLDRAIRELASSEGSPGGPVCTCTGPARDAHDKDCPVRKAHPRLDLGDVPTDPTALATWLYARVVPGHTVVEWTEPSVDRIRTRKASVSAVEPDGDHIVLWPHGDSALYVPPPANHTHRPTKLVNPDGTVLWEAP